MKPIHRLIDYCLEQTAKGNHFFCSYSGHVDTISVWGYRGKWREHKDIIERFSCNISEFDDAKLDKWIGHFNNDLK
jgi:hypothetical protein